MITPEICVSSGLSNLPSVSKPLNNELVSVGGTEYGHIGTTSGKERQAAILHKGPLRVVSIEVQNHAKLSGRIRCLGRRIAPPFTKGTLVLGASERSDVSRAAGKRRRMSPASQACPKLQWHNKSTARVGTPAPS
jgi:hypothetical protein